MLLLQINHAAENIIMMGKNWVLVGLPNPFVQIVYMIMNSLNNTKVEWLFSSELKDSLNSITIPYDLAVVCTTFSDDFYQLWKENDVRKEIFCNRILLIGPDHSRRAADTLLKKGIDGYITFKTTHEEIESAIKSVIAGENFITTNLV